MARLEIRGPLTHDLLPLDRDRLVIGSGDAADLALTSDTAISRVHVLFEAIGEAWIVRDLGSRNGTFVNGSRIVSDRALRDGDEVLIGRTRLTFHDTTRGGPTTDTLAPPPVLTAREREVLVELCRPVLMGNAFTAPTSVQDIGAALFITAPAVKQHLANLYEKFGITETGADRRSNLANAALTQGAVRLSDLKG